MTDKAREKLTEAEREAREELKDYAQMLRSRQAYYTLAKQDRENASQWTAEWQGLNERIAAVERIIDAVPAKYRDICYMHFKYGKTYGEIAELLGYSDDNIRTKRVISLYRCYAAIKKRQIGGVAV